MADLTDFFGSGGGGGLTPKFQEFNSSGTFTPSAGLIAAGGYIEVFLVGGGSKGPGGGYRGGPGGEVIMKKMYLTSVASVSVSIGSGATSTNTNGGDSSFSGSSAGGVDVTALGGAGGGYQQYKFGAGFAGTSNGSVSAASGVLGYGAGGAGGTGDGGVYGGRANTGQGSSESRNAGSGYCLIKWYE